MWGFAPLPTCLQKYYNLVLLVKSGVKLSGVVSKTLKAMTDKDAATKTKRRRILIWDSFDPPVGLYTMKELKNTKLALQPLLPSFVLVIALVILALIEEGQWGGGPAHWSALGPRAGLIRPS